MVLDDQNAVKYGENIKHSAVVSCATCLFLPRLLIYWTDGGQHGIYLMPKKHQT